QRSAIIVPVAVAVVIEGHAVPVVVPPRSVSVGLRFAAIAAVDHITCHATDDGPGNCAACAAARNGVANHAAADCADRRSRIAASLAISSFRAARCDAQNES